MGALKESTFITCSFNLISDGLSLLYIIKSTLVLLGCLNKVLKVNFICPPLSTEEALSFLAKLIGLSAKFEFPGLLVQV
ncbi:hypothetical protein [Clostridium botulinum]|uniref:hypothetical protein n=1 Tax=Clostridium botulinum TaxID=1491 RepID=UPI0021BFD6CB|nr:hypothetical protein [Clostridium botulinum]